MALEKSRGRTPMAGEMAVIVGAGKSGVAMARLLRRSGARVRLLERNPESMSPELLKELRDAGIEILIGPHIPAYFTGASYVIPSPALPIAKVAEYISPEESPEILSEMEMAWRYLHEEPVIAITGTSGKTTTASLTAAMLKAQGYSVFLGGNIGTPLSEYILSNRQADALVLEVSSFQLQGCTTFCPRVGILLNISPNHLDYHKDMAEYIEAKFRLFRCQDENDLAIINENLRAIADDFTIKAQKRWLVDAFRFPNMRLFGKHNSINAEAAWQASRFFGVSQDSAETAVANFAPLPHRLEKVFERNGVLYINDSKCTTVEALRAALDAFERPVRLLCGGKFKGGDLASIRPLIASKVREIALFGGSREIFEEAWKKIVPVSWHETLEEATRSLTANAIPGDVILLAPATSSYDQYKNYQERGEDFKRAARSIK